MAIRLAGRFGYPADEPFRVTFHPERLDEPQRWKRPRRVFAVSMGDMFHDDVPDGWIDQVFATMALCPRHTFLVLTKRPERMATYFAAGVSTNDRYHEIGREISYHCGAVIPGQLSAQAHGLIWPLPNLAVGVTAENQEAAEKRIPLLLATPAAHRFVSLEPLLGPVDLSQWLGLEWSDAGECWIDNQVWAMSGQPRGLDWVIVGPETGPRRRDCDPEWIRSVIDQSKTAGASVFVKAMNIDGTINKDPAEWPEWARVRELPEMAADAAGGAREG